MAISAEYAAVFSRRIRRLTRSVSGATAVEYGLLAGLIALGIAGGVGALADLVVAIFTNLGDTTQGVADTVATP
jgi:pilus assembly protein Flp/PilA